jgi:SAM-dependent methyltransferase
MRTPTADDYRDSHQHKGGSYDRELSESPFDAYLARWDRRHLAQAVARRWPGGIPRYLDFACGTARITAEVAPRAVESVGVDISESMLEIARGKCPSTRFVCADLTRGDHDLGQFDLVTSFRFFGNAQPELRAAGMAAIGSRVRPGGYLIVNNHRNPLAPLELTTRLGPSALPPGLTHWKMRQLLDEHGFDVEETRSMGVWLLRHRWTRPAVLDAPWAERLERALDAGWLAAMAPAAFFIARRR